MCKCKCKNNEILKNFIGDKVSKHLHVCTALAMSTSMPVGNQMCRF